MIFAKEILNLPVFSQTDNKIIGTVQNIIIDTRSHSLFSLIISGDKISKTKNLLSALDILYLGKDGVAIKSLDNLSDKNSLPKGMTLKESGGLILGSKVYDSQRYLGKVYNFTIDDSNELSRIYFKKLLSISNLLEGKIQKIETGKIILAL